MGAWRDLGRGKLCESRRQLKMSCSGSFCQGAQGLQRPFVATILGSHYIPVLKSASFLLKTS